MGRWDSPSPKRRRSRSRDTRDAKKDGYERTSTKRTNIGGADEEREKDRDRDRRRDRDRDRDRNKDTDRYGDRERRGDRDRSGDRHQRKGRRETSRSRGHSNRSRSRSPTRDRDRRKDKESKSHGRPGSPEKIEDDEAAGSPPPKEQPNFNRTHHLVAETNTVNGVVLKYVEPAEARLPPASIKYRLYVFKDSEVVDNIILSSRTAWLVGRDRLVVDLPIDHPSASKQHAAIQFRFISKVNEWGEKEGKVKPYIIDLGSANGTKVNGEEIPQERYYELMDKDVITFAHSTREYVLMLENVK